MHRKALNPVSLGRWLKDHLVDAPINGLVLRARDGPRKAASQFWITKGWDDVMSGGVDREQQRQLGLGGDGVTGDGLRHRQWLGRIWNGAARWLAAPTQGEV